MHISTFFKLFRGIKHKYIWQPKVVHYIKFLEFKEASGILTLAVKVLHNADEALVNIEYFNTSYPDSHDRGLDDIIWLEPLPKYLQLFYGV